MMTFKKNIMLLRGGLLLALLNEAISLLRGNCSTALAYGTSAGKDTSALASSAGARESASLQHD